MTSEKHQGPNAAENTVRSKRLAESETTPQALKEKHLEDKRETARNEHTNHFTSRASAKNS